MKRFYDIFSNVIDAPFSASIPLETVKKRDVVFYTIFGRTNSRSQVFLGLRDK